jgi:hypothetical protein
LKIGQIYYFVENNFVLTRLKLFQTFKVLRARAHIHMYFISASSIFNDIVTP